MEASRLSTTLPTLTTTLLTMSTTSRSQPTLWTTSSVNSLYPFVWYLPDRYSPGRENPVTVRKEDHRIIQLLMDPYICRHELVVGPNRILCLSCGQRVQLGVSKPSERFSLKDWNDHKTACLAQYGGTFQDLKAIKRSRTVSSISSSLDFNLLLI